MVRWLSSLGARTWIVGEIVSVVLLAKSCATPPGETGGAGGEGGSVTASAGGEGGSGGLNTGGGGEGGTGAGGSATGGSVASTGGTGGTGGCEPTVACDAKSCGVVDDGCGVELNCDVKDPNTGMPVTCATQNAGQDQGGPMTCGGGHTCECPAEGNSPEAMALCQGAGAEPAVNDWCVQHGGCSTALCGLPPVPKAPETCIVSGQEAAAGLIWCCAIP